MGFVKRVVALAVAVAITAAVAPAYYHFVHYTNRVGPFVPIAEKFDLNALPNQTVTYRISDQGPTAMAPGESLPAISMPSRRSRAGAPNRSTESPPVSIGRSTSPAKRAIPKAVRYACGRGVLSVC